MTENNPLHPELHNHISDGGASGKSAGEFTGLYYIIGKIWTLTGKQQGLYRLINLSMMFFGLWSLFRGLQTHWNKTFWSIFVSLFVFASPIIVYYTPNYLTDITALALTFWAWGIFLKYIKSHANKHLLVTFILFALAALFKVTAGISLLAILGIYGLELLGMFKENPLFKNKLRTFIYASVSILIVVSWYIHAENYNALHGGKYTFNHIWPIWSLSTEHYNNALNFFYNITYSQLFFIPITWLLAGFTCTALYISFKKNIRAFLFLLFCLLGTTMYLILWFGALENHDYYFINLFFLPIVVLSYNVHFFIIERQNTPRVKTSLGILAVVLFSVGIMYSAMNIRLRYCERLTAGYSLPISIVGKHEVDFWYYTASSSRDRGIYTMEKYNRSIGIKENDWVICYPDISFNHSLYLLNQEGWTTYNNPHYDSTRVQEQIADGAKYLIINKTQLPNTPNIEQFMTDSIGHYDGYTVYKLK